MDILDRYYFGKIIYAIFVIPIKIIITLVKFFKDELLLLLLAFPSCAVWSIYNGPSVWTMELNLLSKLGWNLSYGFVINSELDSKANEMLMLFLICFVLSLFRKISKWTRAAYCGFLSTFAVSFIMPWIRTDYSEIHVPKLIIFVLMLAITLLFARMGFHKDENYVSEDKEVLGMVAGIVPALLYSFITACTIMTATFDTAVEGKFAIVLELVIYGVGIFLYFRFGRDDVETMLRKQGYQVETRVISTTENKSEEPTVEETNDVASDLTLNDDILEQIRNKNNK